MCVLNPLLMCEDCLHNFEGVWFLSFSEGSASVEVKIQIGSINPQ